MSRQPAPSLAPTQELARRRTPPTSGPPPLEPGDHLSRAEFERRYEAHPEIKKAELIEGVVYVPTPVRFKLHGLPHSMVMAWLTTYWAATPEVTVADNTTIRVDNDNELQPDALMRLDPSVGGRSHIDEDDYLQGAPELIVEIATSSASYDLHAKRRVYQRIGVQEYVVLQMYEQQLDWFVLREGVYERLEPDEAGVLRSEVFPGLWLEPKALLSGDLATVLKVLQEGLASPEHAEFVKRLQTAQS